MIPEWMTPDACLPAGVGTESTHRRSGRRSFVRRALRQIAQTLARDVVAERTASQPGLLQGVDARAKLLVMVALLVVTTLVTRPILLAAVLLLCVAVAWRSRVPMRSLAGVWLAVPLFSLVIILPATLNIVTPGAPVATLWRLGPAAHLGPWALPDSIDITASGVASAVRFVLRTGACVALVLVTTATTRPTVLLASLRSLGVPRVFVMVLAMMYRYLTLLLRIAEDLHFAKMSRTIAAGPTRSEQRWVAAGMGFIFRRCQELGDDVYRAMISRGYAGEARLLRPKSLSLRDKAYILSGVVVMAGLLLADRMWL